MTRHVMIVLAVVMMWGCESGPTTSRRPAGGTAAGGGERTPTANRRKPALLIDGEPVSWGQMQPLLVELSGGRVVGELVLDARIAGALSRRGLGVDDTDIAGERQLMLWRFIDQGMASDEDQAMRVLNRLREVRGLGPRRYELFMRRNASLRKLVADEVNITEEMVRQEHERRYGRQVVIRLIVVPLLADAQHLLERLGAGDSFEDLAVRASIHPSSGTGGLLQPFSEEHADVERVVRDVAFETAVGQISSPIAMADGFGLLRVERFIDAEAVALADVREDLTRVARLRVEQLLMNREARVLLEPADVTVLDAELDRQWQERRREMLEMP